jgi:hypothetical protein
LNQYTLNNLKKIKIIIIIIDINLWNLEETAERNIATWYYFRTVRHVPCVKWIGTWKQMTIDDDGIVIAWGIVLHEIKASL